MSCGKKVSKYFCQRSGKFPPWITFNQRKTTSFYTSKYVRVQHWFSNFCSAVDQSSNAKTENITSSNVVSRSSKHGLDLSRKSDDKNCCKQFNWTSSTVTSIIEQTSSISELFSKYSFSIACRLETKNCLFSVDFPLHLNKNRNDFFLIDMKNIEFSRKVFVVVKNNLHFWSNRWTSSKRNFLSTIWSLRFYLLLFFKFDSRGNYEGTKFEWKRNVFFLIGVEILAKKNDEMIDFHRSLPNVLSWKSIIQPTVTFGDVIIVIITSNNLSTTIFIDHYDFSGVKRRKIWIKRLF